MEEPAKAKTNVKIHKKPNPRSTSLRLMYKGTKSCWFGVVYGGKTTACEAPGNASDGWAKNLVPRHQGLCAQRVPAPNQVIPV
ncbi:hypothetical protein ACTWQF_18505 [Streptomyces sp. 8N114]|uniref:hypothetical protein n=1 Tax=Streptomyces sp. 8N114 TaxID=3457419 RepID=UPI003FD524E4